MDNAFLFETEEIHPEVFEKFESQEISYCYFSAFQKYYLFGFQKEPLNLNDIYQLIQVRDHLDYKRRRIRTIRGFILYVLEIMDQDKSYQILKTNLKPFFWRDVKRIISQNKKNGLPNFLFPIQKVDQSLEIKNLKINIDQLKKETIELKNQLENIELKTQLVGNYDLSFRNLKDISDQEKKEIIEKGFQLQAEKKIKLRDYYEGSQKESLLSWKGYRIKYESIRQNNLYKNIKK